MEENSDYGYLLVNVTAVRQTFPIKNAVVKIASSKLPQDVMGTYITDSSGKTERIRLETPRKSLSLTAGSTSLPYADYNISVTADGYAPQYNLNVPVFSGVTSLQTVDLLPLSADNMSEEPRVIDEGREYDL